MLGFVLVWCRCSLVNEDGVRRHVVLGKDTMYERHKNHYTWNILAFPTVRHGCLTSWDSVLLDTSWDSVCFSTRVLNNLGECVLHTAASYPRVTYYYYYYD